MRCATAYNTYSIDTKIAVIQQSNPRLFEGQGVPRTTALYWLKNKQKFLPQKKLDTETIYEQKLKALEAALQKERALNQLMINVRSIFPDNFSKKRVQSKVIKQKIIEQIKACCKRHPLSKCLHAIGLTSSSYRRWISEFRPCQFSGGHCKKKVTGQLTSQEINQMKLFITSKKYAHFSIASLHLYAQRLGLLFCSVDTWYKYVKLNDWRRPKQKIFRKKYKKGIRAKTPNELWHIDVSQIILISGIKVYLQAVIDNFSRFILAWEVSEAISASNTVKLIKRARENAARILGACVGESIMMDQGRENEKTQVTNFLSSSSLNRILAQVDVVFPNTMIEVFFRSLKNNYLYFQKLITIEDVRRKVKFYVTQYSEIIPHSSLEGPTPLKAFKASWTTQDQMVLKNRRKEAVVDRRSSKEQTNGCEVCMVNNFNSPSNIQVSHSSI